VHEPWLVDADTSDSAPPSLSVTVASVASGPALVTWATYVALVPTSRDPSNVGSLIDRSAVDADAMAALEKNASPSVEVSTQRTGRVGSMPLPSASIART
jgi:hypothetical protein